MRGIGTFIGMTTQSVGATAAPLPPVALTPPSISGTGYIGYTLTVVPGTWANSPTQIDYIWEYYDTFLAQWISFGSSQSTTILVTLDAEGHDIRCNAIGSNPAGFGNAVSNTLVALWSPYLAIPASVEGWFDAEATSTIVLAPNVAQWGSRRDVLGSDVVTAATLALQPTYSATGWDGTRPAISFNGTNGLGKTIAAARCKNVSGYRVAMAYKADAFVGSQTRYVSIASGATPVAVRYSTGTNGGQRNVGARPLDAGSFVTAVPSGPAEDLNTHIRVDVAKFLTGGASGEVNIRIDGTVYPTTAVAGWPNTNTSNTDSLSLGIGIQNGSTITGRINARVHEILLLSGVGTNAENEKIEGCLAWRARLTAKLPITHPYKTAPPTLV
jgi:hypothetical protein